MDIPRPLARVTQRPRLLESRKFWDRMGIVLATLLVAAGSISMLFPVVWMLATSFKLSGDVFLVPPKWITWPPHFENYPIALKIMHAERVYPNTVIISIFSLVGDVLSASFVAFGFARLRGPGKNPLFILLLSTTMIPIHVLLIPQFLVFKVIGWVDTFLPLIVPTYFGSAFTIFLVRQFYMTIPLEMDDAAKIDGAGYLQIWWRIAVPLSLPVLAIVGINSIIYHWNDFLRPLIFLHRPENITVAIALRNFQADFGGTPWNLMMAASVVALVPTVILFFVAQRYFIQGIVITGVKG